MVCYSYVLMHLSMVDLGVHVVLMFGSASLRMLYQFSVLVWSVHLCWYVV